MHDEPPVEVLPVAVLGRIPVKLLLGDERLDEKEGGSTASIGSR